MSTSRTGAARAADPGPAPVALGGLDTQVGFMLRLAQVAVLKDLVGALHPFGLRPTDFSVLLTIESTPGLTQRAVGAALGIHRPNVGGILDQLEAQGLVERGAAPGDRRSYALTLTPVGRRLLARAKAAHARHTDRLSAALGGADRPLVLEALARIARMA